MYFKGLIGQPDRDGECHDDATSINGFCRYKSLEGGACDVDDRDDCLDEENYCLDQICKTPGNVACQSNGSCGNDSLTCVNGSCAEKGGSCDEGDNYDCNESQLCHRETVTSEFTCHNSENLICVDNDVCPYNEQPVCRKQIIDEQETRVCASIGSAYDSTENNNGDNNSFCDATDDCDNELICHQGICRTEDKLLCESDEGCPEGRPLCFAQDGFSSCLPKRGAGESCINTSDCDQELVCHVSNEQGEKSCQPPTNLFCSTENNCAAFFEEGADVEITGVRDRCISNKCAPKANADNACDQNEDADCGEDLYCHQSLCKLAENLNCNNDDECSRYNGNHSLANHHICHENRCVSSSNLSCNDDSNCSRFIQGFAKAPGFINCVSGKCSDSILEGGACENDNNCVTGLLCHTSTPNGQTVCTQPANLDCTENSVCENHEATPVCRRQGDEGTNKCATRGIAYTSTQNNNGDNTSFCDEDNDCENGLSCHFNVCRSYDQNAECTENSECHIYQDSNNEPMTCRPTSWGDDKGLRVQNKSCFSH